MHDERSNRIARKIARDVAAGRLDFRRSIQELQFHADALEDRQIGGIANAVRAHCERLEEFLAGLAEASRTLATITADEPTHPGITLPGTHREG